MRPVSQSDIVGLDRYESVRPDYRQAVIEHKAARRLGVGEKVTLVFEDRETLRFQIQEMVWIERISDPTKVQHEIDVYNELIPGTNELSATLFIQITDEPEIRPELDRLIGLDEHVSLVIGSGADEATVRAQFDAKQMEEERLSAVQYIRFVLSAAQAERFLDPAERLRVRIDHPNYAQEAELPADTRASLTQGLAGEPESLLDVSEIGGPFEDVVLHEGQRVRAVRPAHRPSPDWIVVEALEPGGDLTTAGPELMREALELVQRFASELSAKHGRCRVQTDVDPELDRLRWHIYPPRT